MSGVDDINDRDSLRAWLEGRSREDAVLIAYRAAMRVAPLYFAYVQGQEKGDLTETVVLRALLISGVAGTCPTPEIKAAARADAAAFAADAAAFAAAAAAAAAAFADAAAAAFADAAAAAFAAADAAADAAAWEAVRADAQALLDNKSLSDRKLWPRAGPLQPAWAQVNRTWRRRGTPLWDFWADWYRDALNGRKQTWPLLEQIALLPPKIWEGPEAELEAEITRVRADFAIDNSPNAERLVEDAKSHRLRSEELTDLPALNLDDVKTKMRMAAQIFPNDPSGVQTYGALAAEVAMIREAAAEKDIRALALYDVCRRAARRTRRKAEVGECPSIADELVDDFLEQLQETQLDILNFDAQTNRVVTSRANVRSLDAPQDKIAVVREAAKDVAKVSEDALAQEVIEDAEIIADPDADPEARRIAIYREGSRMLRIWRAVNGHIKGWKDATDPIAGLTKNVTVLLGASAALAGAVAWFLGLLT